MGVGANNVSSALANYLAVRALPIRLLWLPGAWLAAMRHSYAHVPNTLKAKI
jgi:hypothetical protein